LRNESDLLAFIMEMKMCESVHGDLRHV
jgi:hypothetical protein